ncbi:MAG TPA: riboflavin synthase [Candidatus Ruania gallistercoris]|uniref:Riboflavin synthase n=1 Tax=Candidatus Ruania gallistercoris TaxID=2838746 RepID=A0A9D2J312_9MICO|nr:riboflavin synthase [Candidatus Ruania gallistercoris]
MFTGIVEELGTVADLRHGRESAVLAVHAPLGCHDAAVGDSIAVNGVCLTVTGLAGETFTADVMAETLEHSTLGSLDPGDRVNIERAMPADGRFGGHLVLGHVDATAAVLERRAGEAWEVVRLELPEALAAHVVLKGSIALDGVSLTVSALGDGFAEVSLIPATLAATTLGQRSPGTRVNIETDVLAKHVQRLLTVDGGQ